MEKYFVSGLTEEDSLQGGQNKQEEHRNCQTKRSTRKGPDLQGRGKKKKDTLKRTLGSKKQYFLLRKSSRTIECGLGPKGTTTVITQTTMPFKLVRLSAVLTFFKF